MFINGNELSIVDILMYNSYSNTLGILTSLADPTLPPSLDMSIPSMSHYIDALKLKYPFVYAWYMSMNNIDAVQKYVQQFQEETLTEIGRIVE